MSQTRRCLRIWCCLLLGIAVAASRPVAAVQSFCFGNPIPPPPPAGETPPSSQCGGGGSSDCGKENCTGSPCYPANGGYSTSAMDLALGTAGFSLDASRNYLSLRSIDGPLGRGWTSSLTGRLYYATYLLAAPSTVQKEADLLLPSGAAYRFTDNGNGTFTPPTGRHDRLVLNGDGSFDFHPERTMAVYHFGGDGSLQSMVDDYGNTLTYVYDTSGRLQQVTDASGSGRFLNVFWGADGRISAIQDSAGRQVLYAYSSQGSLTSVTDPAGRVTSYGYTQGRFAPLLSTVTDNWNRAVTAVTYDTFDRVTSYVDKGETWTYTYSYAAGIYYGTSKADSAGHTWQYTYLPSGQVTDRVAPHLGNNPLWHTDYNGDGSVQQTTDPAGVKTAYTYDAAGNVLSVATYSPVARAFTLRRDYTFDPNFPGRVTSMTPRDPATGLVNPDWQAWRYDYWQVGDPAPGALHHVYRVESDGTTLDTLETYTYDTQGRMLSETDAEGAVTSYVYDAQGNLSSVTAPAANDTGVRPTTTYAYDAVGRLLKETDPLGNQTLYSYDAIGRVLTVTLPQPTAGSSLNFTTTYGYDSFDASTGLLFSSVTDPSGNVSRRGDDAYGRVVQSIDALGAVTVNGYTADLLASVTDANGNVTTYSYDQVKRLTATTFPDGAQETNRWNDDNSLAGIIDRRQQFAHRFYDEFKRIAEEQYDSPYTYPTSEYIYYTYQGQKLVTVNDQTASPQETHTYTYDHSNRLTADSQATRGTVNYTYTPADRIASMAVAGGPTTSYTYYADGGLDTIQWSLVSGQFKYSYDLRGLYQTITFPNGQHRDFTYDNQRRLLQLANLHPSAGNLATFAYGYDLDGTTGQPTALGERTTMTADVPSQGLTGAVTRYGYDRSYQLVQAQYPNAAPFSGEIDSWAYDVIGNRLTSTVNGVAQAYAYQKVGTNSNNWQRLVSDGINTYSYDPNGNATTQTGPGGAWTFDSSPRNELRNIHLGGSAYAAYYFDYQGRRTSKWTAIAATSTYLYDGLNLIGETGASTAWYLYGPGIDQPLAVVRGGTLSYYSIDGLGSTVVTSDSTGTLQGGFVFDAWGGTRQMTGNPGPLGYTGREVGEAGMLAYRARYYMPAIGRMTQEDPFGPRAAGSRGLNQKSVNAYAYADSDPVNNLDPTGMFTVTCADVTAGPGTAEGGIWRSFIHHAFGADANSLTFRGSCPPEKPRVVAVHLYAVGASPWTPPEWPFPQGWVLRWEQTGASFVITVDVPSRTMTKHREDLARVRARVKCCCVK